LWKSQFLIVLCLEVMKKKLSQKERSEVVSKGFLEDYLESKNYVTKDWAYKMFETFEKRILTSFDEKINQVQKENRQYFETLLEYMDEKFNIFLEKVDARIERIERYVGLSPL